MTRNIRIGSLCTGYGGLDMAALTVLGGHLAWCADNDRHVSIVLAARYPGIPNLGDITALDWSRAEPVDVICAGFPCQDISNAGPRTGIKRGTRSGIWINIVQGVRLLAPKIVIVENVAALRRRGLDRVLGDLAALGYDAVWTSLRAGDVGAPHRRERVFVLAYRPEAEDLLTAADASSQRRAERSASGSAPGGRLPGGPLRPGDHPVPGGAALADAAGGSRHVAEPAEYPWQLHARRGSGGQDQAARADDIDWGKYEPAIRRWEAVTGRPAPPPTEPGTRGQTRLAAQFSEWLMGLPHGFVTDLGLPYGAQHRILGNGVVPRQAEAALRKLVAQALDLYAEDWSLPSAA
jgi:DNA (cytosine-5)-methyltransferase 1